MIRIHNIHPFFLCVQGRAATILQDDGQYDPIARCCGRSGQLYQTKPTRPGKKTVIWLLRHGFIGFTECRSLFFCSVVIVADAIQLYIC